MICVAGSRSYHVHRCCFPSNSTAPSGPIRPQHEPLGAPFPGIEIFLRLRISRKIIPVPALRLLLKLGCERWEEFAAEFQTATVERRRGSGQFIVIQRDHGGISVPPKRYELHYECDVPSRCFPRLPRDGLPQPLARFFYVAGGQIADGRLVPSRSTPGR